MPIITLNLDPSGGPIVYAFVGLSAPHREVLTATGRSLPTSNLGRFLIDTGASGSAVDPGMLDGLDLRPTGAITVHTPSTEGRPISMAMFDVSILIPAGEHDAPLYIPAIPVSASGFKAQGIDGLLGRDVLAQCLLSYNGRIGSFTLAF